MNRRPLLVLSIVCSLFFCRFAKGEEPIRDYVRQEVEQALTQFHVNRAVKEPYATRITGDYTFIDPSRSTESRYIQLNMVVASSPAKPMEHGACTRTDYNIDRIVEGQSRPSLYWFTRLTRDGKLFYNVNGAWSQIPPDSKTVIPGMNFDLWSIAVCQFGDFAHRKVSDSYFDMITQPSQLIEASLEPKHIVATWLVSPRKDAKATIRFDRNSKMPIDAQWHAKVEQRENGQAKEKWMKLGNTATTWKRNGLSQWVPVKVSIIASAGNERSHRTYQWDLELDWTFGRAIQPEWFDPNVAPDGGLLFQILQL